MTLQSLRILLNRVRYAIRTLPFALTRRRDTRRALDHVSRFPSITTRHPHGLPGKLIVSLTSYPGRFPTLANSLKSVLDQKTAADRTILWIAHQDRAALPADVLGLCRHGLEILSSDDLRSYKKIIPLLETEPDAFIVTCDDDVYYDPDWLTVLTAAYDEDCPAIIARRMHRPKRDPAGRMLPYRLWQFNIITPHPSPAGLFPTGVGGILYPPGCFDDRVLDRAQFMRLCPFGDDIWLYWMGRLGGSSYRQAGPFFRPVEWPRSQESSLFSNNADTGNNAQILAMEEVYGPV